MVRRASPGLQADPLPAFGVIVLFSLTGGLDLYFPSDQGIRAVMCQSLVCTRSHLFSSIRPWDRLTHTCSCVATCMHECSVSSMVGTSQGCAET